MDDLEMRFSLARGDEDCTCNAAGHSPVWQEHDPHCAFRLIYEAKARIADLERQLAEALAALERIRDRADTAQKGESWNALDDCGETARAALSQQKE